MSDLSPAAQAVLDAANYVYDRAGTTGHGLAAALRAAVEQVLPKRPLYSYLDDYEFGTWDARNDARNAFFAIAEELEGAK
jgi:hypothetical protein